MAEGEARALGGGSQAARGPMTEFCFNGPVHEKNQGLDRTEL